MNESHVRNVIEAALLAAGKPLQPAELAALFDEPGRPRLEDVRGALDTLAAGYADRGIELAQTAAGFRIQVRREMANEILRLWPERPAKYSRALLETLALIAYRQPITRGEIEAVRGVAVNPNIVKTIIERNWVRVVGHRDVPGRPELLGTTREFLDYFGLRTLDELPPLAEIKSLGEIKVQFALPDPGPLPAAVKIEEPQPLRTPGEAIGSAAGVADRGVDEPRSDRSSGEGGSSCESGSSDEGGSSSDDDSSDEEELTAAPAGARELVAGPRGLDD